MFNYTLEYGTSKSAQETELKKNQNKSESQKALRQQRSTKSQNLWKLIKVVSSIYCRSTGLVVVKSNAPKTVKQVSWRKDLAWCSAKADEVKLKSKEFVMFILVVMVFI